MKFSCTYDNAESAQRKLDALRNQHKTAWITHTPDGKSHVFWMMAGLDTEVASERFLLFPHRSRPFLEQPSTS